MKAQKCVENIVPGLEVPEFQNIGVQEALLNKRMLLAFDTGTGKTFTYGMFVRGLLNRNPERKHILVIIHDSLTQVPKNIRNLVRVPTGAFSATYDDTLRLYSMWDRLSIIIVTYDIFRDERFVEFLFDHLVEVESFTIDEAHHAANWDESDTAFMIRAFAHHCNYIVALSATPITREAYQFYQLMNLVDRNLSSHRDETPWGKYDERYLPVNRKDYDIKGKYKTTLEIVTPQLRQMGSIKGIVSKVTKGTGAVPQVTALMRIASERLRNDKKVIIYVQYHDTRRWVEEHLTMHNIPFVSLHGKIVNQRERNDIIAQFSEGRVSVMVTTVTESLNIDADVVIFYEFTTKIKQVMGRAHRGLSEKELELVFIITKDTDEVDYFMDYIYYRSLTIQQLLKKDYSEFVEVGRRLKEMQLNDGT